MNIVDIMNTADNTMITASNHGAIPSSGAATTHNVRPAVITTLHT